MTTLEAVLTPLFFHMTDHDHAIRHSLDLMFSCSYIGFFSWARKTTCSCECVFTSIKYTYYHSYNLLFFFQDPFQLWEKSAAGRSLFSRAHERHVFLFEKMIIFSKKTEVASQKKDKKSDNYLYKAHLSVCYLTFVDRLECTCTCIPSSH